MHETCKTRLHLNCEEPIDVLHVEHRLIPVYGEIPCGDFSFLDDEPNGYLEIPNNMLGIGDYFVLKAKGDSMVGADICNGDLVIIKKQNHAEESQIVVAFVDGETTLKRFHKNEKQQIIELRPDSDCHDVISVEDCLILGIAVKVIKDLK